jgi:hypothetical protein
MHRDVVDIRNGAETLTLSRFAAFPEYRRERGSRDGVDRALRRARGDPCAMAELRAFLSLHALLPFGYVLTDEEVLRIADAAIRCGALEARLAVDPKQYQPTGPAAAPPLAPPSSATTAQPILARSSQEAERDYSNEKAQAATQDEAAKNGTPFCEICEKMKAERARAGA